MVFLLRLRSAALGVPFSKELVICGGSRLVISFLLLGASWSLNSSLCPFELFWDLSSLATGEACDKTLLSDLDDLDSFRAGSFGVEAS